MPKIRKKYAVTPTGKHQDYRWMDKDPICDVLRTLIQRDGRTPTAIAEQARLGHMTVNKILYGTTRKPFHTTVSALAEALGYKITWLASGQPNIIIPPYLKPEKEPT